MLLLPIGTDRRLSSLPWATLALIALNVYVYFALQGGPRGESLALVFSRFEWWMPVTYMFAHGSLWHLGANMLFLWVFGAHAEDALGRGRYLLLYFSAGLAAALLHGLSTATFYPSDLEVPLLGASGAIMGVVSLFVLRFHGVQVRFLLWIILPYFFQIRALWVGIVYVAWDLGWAIAAAGAEGIGGVAHWAHVGGFVVGAIWAWALRLPEEGTDDLQADEVRTLIASGAWAQAAGVLHERLQRNPNEPDLHRQIATCYEMMRGTRSLAVEHWNEHLRLLLLAGRHQEAAERFRTLTADYEPADFAPSVLLRIGTAFERSGDYDDALLAWLAIPRAHRNTPQAPVATMRAANLAQRNGDLHRARRLLRAIERYWPDSPQSLTARERLAELES
ncbi:MAG: rhomboid family intramembrane serine protease [Armatimonadetes bacterium]|nr:rhomboid family intramembrane serine protease [Armatimonadota bacterium]